MFLFYLPFQYLSGHVNAWVLLWDWFRWKHDILGGVGIYLRLILDHACLKISKNCFCLWACIRSLNSCICGSVLVYVGLFLGFCICGSGSTYVRSCLCTRALTCIPEMPSKSLTLPIFIYFSSVSLRYVILTNLFVIFALEYHCILLFIFILESKYHFS